MGQRRSIAGARILITGASQGIGRAAGGTGGAARGGRTSWPAARSDDLLAELAEKVRGAGGIIETVRGRRDRAMTTGSCMVEDGELPFSWPRRARLTTRVFRRHRPFYGRHGPERLSQDHGGEFFRRDRDDARLSAAIESRNEAGDRQHLVDRRQAAVSRPAANTLGEQVRGAGLQRGAAGGTGARTAST